MVSLLGDVKPLKEYLTDKKELIEVMFSCIEDNQLKKMIPDVLKDARLEEVKAECLVELLGMSKKRVIGILEGRELEESSEDSLELSDISDDADDDIIKSERETPDRPNRKKDRREAKSSVVKKKLQSSSSDSDMEEAPPKRKKTKKKIEESPAKDSVSKKADDRGKKKNKGGESGKVVKEVDPLPEPEAQIEIPVVEKKGKNLLEILELEMRARAIRSLLEREEKKNKGPGGGEPSTSVIFNDAPEPLDNDPDAVILIDETADQIDLTKDESDSEQQVVSKDDIQTETSKDKSMTSQVRNYRSNKEHSPTTSKTQSVEVNVDPAEASDQTQNSVSDRFVPKNWTERWLDSNDVQKVMKTTKVLTNLKKRLIQVNKQKSEEEKICVEPAEKVAIEGTVAEYSRLDSKLNDKVDVVHAGSPSQVDSDLNPEHPSQDAESAVETFITKDEMKTITDSENIDNEASTTQRPHPDEQNCATESAAQSSSGGSNEGELEINLSVRGNDLD